MKDVTRQRHAVEMRGMRDAHAILVAKPEGH
jgi:hypothetical protein